MDFVAHWKNWIRPVALLAYILVMMAAIPLCVIEVTKKNNDKHVKAWFTGGVFVLMAVPISFWEIILHTINYTQPHLQKYIIRIIWMVPIYALNAWFGLRFKDATIYLDTIRECYEAYVIYNFMAYLLSYLWTVHPQLEIALRGKRPQKHLIPFCCLPWWRMGRPMIQNCKHGALQYTIVRPVTTVIALICQLNGVYHEGKISADSAWIYLTVINNISQIWAMYCLVLFYKATKEMLAPIKPIPKFLCVKFVVFFSFWQSVVIAIFAKLGLIPRTEFYDYNIDDIAAATQDFCVCIEMFIAAIMHYFAFSHKPFIDQNAPQGNCWASFWSMWDITDMKDDVVEHVNIISTTMKKTISRQAIKNQDDESTPLLLMASNNPTTSGEYETNNEQTVQVEINQTGYQGAADTQSCVSDWDVASVDRWNTKSSRGTKSVSSSMHNYLDSGSIENQSIEHLDDPDSRTRHLSDKDQSVKGSDRKQSVSASILEESSEYDRNSPQEIEQDNKVLIDFEEEVEENQGKDETVTDENVAADTQNLPQACTGAEDHQSDKLENKNEEES